MQNKNEEIMAWEQIMKIFSNEDTNVETKEIRDKILAIEDYILKLDFKTLTFNEIATYYDLLVKIHMQRKNLKSTREFLELSDKLKSQAFKMEGE